MRVHFIGIGGIGVSALAKYYLEKGHQVTGSDLVSSEITKALKKKGVKVFIGKHRAKNLPKNADKIIYSPAVQKSNLELKTAFKIQISKKSRGYETDKAQIMSYPEALGELTKEYFTIAISGTHGKSTTTAMIGLILAKARLDPTVIVGTKLREFASRQKNSGESNCRVGKNKYLVIEACEHEESFLNYWPEIIVVTNIEEEHLDYYKSLKNILGAFRKFIGHLPKEGVLAVNKDDKNIQKIISNFQFPIFNKFSISDFQLKSRSALKLKKILKVPGEHNVANALAALTVARALKIPDKISFNALSKYRGSWRRFEEKNLKIGNWKLKIISDYAHHPTEIRVTLKAAREKYPKKKIWCVFQPHQYQRTFYLFDDFVKVFQEAPIDKLIITDIYDVAGREEKKIKEKISSEKLVKRIPSTRFRNIIFIPTIKKAARYLRKNLGGGEVVIVMGAGDIYKLVDLLT